VPFSRAPLNSSLGQHTIKADDEVLHRRGDLDFFARPDESAACFAVRTFGDQLEGEEALKRAIRSLNEKMEAAHTESDSLQLVSLLLVVEL
jgi:hypothetical protein